MVKMVTKNSIGDIVPVCAAVVDAILLLVFVVVVRIVVRAWTVDLVWLVILSSVK